MLFYETCLLLFWYSLWNLLDKFYQYNFNDKEMETNKYIFYNGFIVVLSVVLLYINRKNNGKSFN